MREERKTLLFGMGGVGAALASALCCAGPLVTVAAGVSGVGLAATFDPLRPWFLAATAAFLLLGFWTVGREERKACEAGRPCAEPRARRRMKAMLWIATAIAVVFATFPGWLGVVLSGQDDLEQWGQPAVTATEPAAASEPPAGPYRTITLEVAGMTCAGCAATARVAMQRIEGVKEATFSYPEGTGLVIYDTTKVAPPALIAQLARRTGFQATVRAC